MHNTIYHTNCVILVYIYIYCYTIHKPIVHTYILTCFKMFATHMLDFTSMRIDTGNKINTNNLYCCLFVHFI